MWSFAHILYGVKITVWYHQLSVSHMHCTVVCYRYEKLYRRFVAGDHLACRRDIGDGYGACCVHLRQGACGSTAQISTA